MKIKDFVLGVALVFLGITAWAADPVELVFWHMEARPNRVERIQEVCERFNTEHPDIKIVPYVQSWGEIYQLAPAAIQAGRGPDFILTTPDFLTYVKALGAVQPVDKLIESLQQEYSFIQSALTPYYFDDHYWAVPIYGMDFVFWYRKDIFEQAGLDPNRPPKTWPELLEICEKLKASEVVKHPIAVPGAIHMATDQLIYTLMIVNKAEHIFGEDPNEIIFDNPRTVEAYSFYKQLFDYSPPGSAAWAWDEPRTALFTGQVAIVMEKGHYLKGWIDSTDLPLAYLGCAPIPVPEDGQPGTIYYSNGLMLLTEDLEKQVAFNEFLAWLFQPEIMSWLVHMDPGFFLPVTREVLYSDAFWDEPTIKEKVAAVVIQIDYSEYGKLFGFTRETVNPNAGAIAASNILAWVAQQITVGGLPPEEAVKLGAQRIEEVIRE